MKGSILKALVVVAVCSSTAFGQFTFETFSYDFCGGGARAQGMGKAFLGVSDDATGGSWNPAGIYTIEKPVTSITWSSLAPRGAANTMLLNTPSHLDHSGSLSAVSALSFTSPFRIKGHPFVGSFSYTRNFYTFEEVGFEAAFQTLFRNPFDPTEFDILSTEISGSTNLDGGLYSVNFAFGTRLYNNISFGLSTNLYTGKSTRQLFQINTTHDYFYQSDQRGLLEEHTTLTDTMKYSGFNFTIGFKYSGDKMDAGLVVRTPYELSVEYDSTVYHLAYMDGLIEDDFTDTVYFMDNLTKYDVPWIVGFGLAYNVTENLLLAADAEFRTFKGGKINQRLAITINPGGDNEETYLEYDPRWDNVFTVRLGTEYLWQTGIGVVPLRTGVGYCPEPDLNINALGETSTATNYSFSLGSGIHWEQIMFDVAYSVSTIDRQYVLLEQGITAGDYTNRDHHLNIQFTGVF